MTNEVINSVESVDLEHIAEKALHGFLIQNFSKVLKISDANANVQFVIKNPEYDRKSRENVFHLSMAYEDGIVVKTKKYKHFELRHNDFAEMVYVVIKSEDEDGITTVLQSKPTTLPRNIKTTLYSLVIRNIENYRVVPTVNNPYVRTQSQNEYMADVLNMANVTLDGWSAEKDSLNSKMFKLFWASILDALITLKAPFGKEPLIDLQTQSFFNGIYRWTIEVKDIDSNNSSYYRLVVDVQDTYKPTAILYDSNDSHTHVNMGGRNPRWLLTFQHYFFYNLLMGGFEGFKTYHDSYDNLVKLSKETYTTEYYTPIVH